MGQTALLIVILYLIFSKNNDFLSDILSSVTPEEIEPLFKLFGIDQSVLNSALSLLPDLLNGDFNPGELIKKSLPLLISFLSKSKPNNNSSTDFSTDNEGFAPVADFIPSDIKNDLSAFFN